MRFVQYQPAENGTGRIAYEQYPASEGSSTRDRAINVIVFGAGEVEFGADGPIDPNVQTLASESQRTNQLTGTFNEFLKINKLASTLFEWTSKKIDEYSKVLHAPTSYPFPAILVDVTQYLQVPGRTDVSEGTWESPRADSPFVTMKLSPRKMVTSGVSGAGPMTLLPWKACGYVIAHEIFAHAIPALIRPRVTYSVPDLGHIGDRALITHEKIDQFPVSNGNLGAADLENGWKLDATPKQMLFTLQKMMK